MPEKKFDFFNELNVSTFAELLASINRHIVDNVKRGQSLSDYNSLSIGVDESSTQYPYLMVHPMVETIERRYTKPYADVIRDVRFVTRTLKPTQNASFGQAMGLSNNIKNYFKRKIENYIWQLEKSNGARIVYNTDIGDIEFSDYQSYSQGVVSEVTMTISFYCQIELDELRPISTTELDETNLKEMTKIIHEIIKSYRSGYLPEIKTLKYGASEPISHYPAIVVTPSTGDIESRFVGTDTYESEYFVYAYTDFLNAPNSIYENLDIMHKIRAILLANRFLFNRTYDVAVDTINYGTSFFKDIGYYTGQLVVNSSSFEKHPIDPAVI
jgi:hypothetical protein